MAYLSKNLLLMMGIMAGSSVIAASQAWAQMQPQQSEAASKQSQIMERINTAQTRASTLQEQINAIAQKAQAENPVIQSLHEELMKTYETKLAEYGYPNEAEMQKLREMQQRLQTPGDNEMGEVERQQLTQTFNTEVAKLQVAQEKAQRDAEVIAAQQALEKANSEAMNEINPEAQALQRELEIVQEKIENLRLQLQEALQATQ